MIKRKFFVGNRRELITACEGGLVVLTAHTLMQLTADSAAPFRQDANFWYLTGIDEPDWWLIVDGTHAKSWLVSPRVSELRQVFDGVLSSADAQAISGVDEVIFRDEAETLLRDLARKHSVVHTLGKDPHAEYYDFTLNPAQHEMWQRLDRIFHSVQDCRSKIARLRAIKQPEEVRAIKRAVELTQNAFMSVKDALHEFTHEYQVEAMFSYSFRNNNAQHAYDPIIAAGRNACTLHYVRNNTRLPHDGLVLMDVGARINGYAADITRTYAVGSPTPRQRAIHAAVRRAHQEIIDTLRPGYSVREYQDNVNAIMKEALRSIGLLTVDDDAVYRRYFPHAISHGLGIDVHDSLGSPTVFEPGMILTVEPGVYIPEESIGVRIEDDILITEKGHQNLSRALLTDM